MSPAVIVVAAAAGTLVVGLLAWILGPYLQARVSGVSLSLLQVVGMRFRGTDAATIVMGLIALNKLGEPVAPEELEAISMSLPQDQRNWSRLIRVARPGLIARLEQARILQ